MGAGEPYPYYGNFNDFFRTAKEPIYDFKTEEQIDPKQVIEKLQLLEQLAAIIGNLSKDKDKISIDKNLFKDHLVRFLKEGLEISIDVDSQNFNNKVNKFLKVLEENNYNE